MTHYLFLSIALAVGISALGWVLYWLDKNFYFIPDAPDENHYEESDALTGVCKDCSRDGAEFFRHSEPYPVGTRLICRECGIAFASMKFT